MRRIALLLLPTLLAGCGAYVGNPSAGLGGFLGDVFSLGGNSNRPAIDSDNARRVMGATVETEPLQVEAGNVWPGPLPPARTMSDMQRDMGTLPPIDAPRGSSSPPPPAATPASLPAARPIPSQPPVRAVPAGRVLQTPGGPATTTIGGNGVETFTLPGGRSGIVMPNANGTLTLIGPDGTTQTIPAPR
jgi:hypothetical protein